MSVIQVANTLRFLNSKSNINQEIYDGSLGKIKEFRYGYQTNQLFVIMKLYDNPIVHFYATLDVKILQNWNIFEQYASDLINLSIAMSFEQYPFMFRFLTHNMHVIELKIDSQGKITVDANPIFEENRDEILKDIDISEVKNVFHGNINQKLIFLHENIVYEVVTNSFNAFLLKLAKVDKKINYAVIDINLFIGYITKTKELFFIEDNISIQNVQKVTVKNSWILYIDDGDNLRSTSADYPIFPGAIIATNVINICPSDEEYSVYILCAEGVKILRNFTRQITEELIIQSDDVKFAIDSSHDVMLVKKDKRSRKTKSARK